MHQLVAAERIEKRSLVGDAADAKVFWVVLEKGRPLAGAGSLARCAREHRFEHPQDSPVTSALGTWRQAHQVTERVDSFGNHPLLRLGPDAGQLAHGQRQQERALGACRHEQHARRLGAPTGDLGDDATRTNPRARRQARVLPNRLTHRAHGALDRNIAVRVACLLVQALAAGKVEIELVDARGAHLGRVSIEHRTNPLGVRRVHAMPWWHEDCFRWCQATGIAQRHPRADAIGAHFVACRGDHAASPASSTHYDRFALKRRIEQSLHRDEERVQIQTADARDHS